MPGGNQATWLASQAGYSSVFRPSNYFWLLPPIAEGLAFLAPRASISMSWVDVPSFPGAGPSRIILRTEVRGLLVYNVHFPLREKARAIEARMLANLVRNNSKPAIVVGDLNTRPQEYPLEILRRAGFMDLWTRGRSRSEEDDHWPDRDRIDYALGLGFDPGRASVTRVGMDRERTGIYPSDHPGLLIDLDPDP